MVVYALIASLSLNLLTLLILLFAFRRRVLSFWSRRRKALLRASRSLRTAILRDCLYPIFRRLPLLENVAVFESYRGENFSGNPKYIMLELAARAPHFKCVFAVQNRVDVNYGPNCRQVRRMGLLYYYYLARAKYTVNNVNFPDFLVKRPGTVHIQTMHGTPLKLMGSDIIRVQEKAHTIDLLGLFVRSKRWDVLVCPNAYTAQIFSRVFRYRGKILECGYPRNDIFIQRGNDLEYQRKLKESLGLPIDKKIILYAPTWKDYSATRKISDVSDLGIDLLTLRRILGDDYIILFKLHHLVTNGLNFDPYAGFAWSMSHHSDIQELCLISDCLVTDYSSVMFDYASLGRPMVFFISDFERYAGARGFYFDMAERVPGPLVRTTEDLAHAILRMDEDRPLYAQKYEKFRAEFSSWEKGTAAKRVVDEYILTSEAPRP